MECSKQIGGSRERRSRPHQGRRVTSNTFTILGASTPEFRITIPVPSRKQKRLFGQRFFVIADTVIHSDNTALPRYAIISALL